MSRASEWATINALADKIGHPFGRALRLNHPEQHGRVMVERDGKCYLELRHEGIATVGGSLDPADALALAKWITDTFEEAQP